MAKGHLGVQQGLRAAQRVGSTNGIHAVLQRGLGPHCTKMVQHLPMLFHCIVVGRPQQLKGYARNKRRSQAQERKLSAHAKAEEHAGAPSHVLMVDAPAAAQQVARTQREEQISPSSTRDTVQIFDEQFAVQRIHARQQGDGRPWRRAGFQFLSFIENLPDAHNAEHLPIRERDAEHQRVIARAAKSFNPLHAHAAWCKCHL